LALGLASLAAGCDGGGTADATGTVLYRGKPVTAGTVVMVGPDGRAAMGEIGGDGSYRIEGVAAGAVKVGVSVPLPDSWTSEGQAGRRGVRDRQGVHAPARPTPPTSPKEAVPLTYGDPDTSGLQAELRPGSNRHDVTIE
jgi:hypothetical protein